MSLTREAVLRLGGAVEVKPDLFHIFKEELVYVPKLCRTVPLRVRVGVVRFGKHGEILSQEGIFSSSGAVSCYKRVIRPWKKGRGAK